MSLVHQYHDGTKHHFHRFARSLGYLDWASQPKAFRLFAGSPVFPLYPSPAAATSAAAGPGPSAAVAYDQLFEEPASAPAKLHAAIIGDLLRHALGLSAWKEFRDSRWSLRVNPSSGNLHPTEAYVIGPALDGLADGPAVYHYAADRHALELRCWLDRGRSERAFANQIVVVAFTSIHWRESWKYGERAFRYCQHDLGHAIGAVRLAAAIFGWHAQMLPGWPHRAVAALTGIDRAADFDEAEPEEPGCIMVIHARGFDEAIQTPDALVDAARHGRWIGRASQLSVDHVQWTFIDEIARATEDPGRNPDRSEPLVARGGRPATGLSRDIDARAILLRRRSALGFDGASMVDRRIFLDLLTRAVPTALAPWDAMWWSARIHLALFVHAVEDLAPGLYFLVRDRSAIERLRAACRPEFEWVPADHGLPLFRLAAGDCRGLARRLSCDQEIASDGFFSLGMIADFDRSLEEFGPSFYRHLFWESGVIGQVLYLEAEAAGARATGIGCFYDDPVHEVLGLHGHAFQSLYHFTVGLPVDDRRLTTEPGYEWERRPPQQ